MSCCRAISDQLTAVDVAKARLSGSRSRTPEELASAVSTTLDTCRSLLGTYRVSQKLTTEFRQEIEPDLANIWTAQELNSYAAKLHQFSGVLKDTLMRWRHRHCKEALSA